MDPIGYLMHGHPLCSRCFDDDYRLDNNGAAYAHDGQSVAAAVAPIHTGDPDDGVPCAGCGQPLAAPADAGAAGIVWTCPYCGSNDLRVLYDERRACRVTTLNDTSDPADAEPWPSYAGDEFVDIDPGSFAFHCDACNTHDITPRKGGGISDLGHRQAA